MRILNLQNAVVVSLLATGIVGSACSSSDAPRPTGTAGAGTAGAGTAGAGTAGTVSAGGDGSSGAPVTGGAGTTSSGGADPTAGAPPVGGGAGGGSSTTGVCAGLGTKTLAATDAFVDNFECPASIASFCNASNVANGWSTFNDLGAPGADAADNMVKMKQIMPGYMSASAGQYIGAMANTSKTPPGFGVGAIFNVAIDPTAGIYCADISAFDGISFWAKTGIAAGSTVAVNFVLPNTNAEVKNADGKEAGGDCVGMTCYNHPKKSITLTGTWAQYTVAFADAAGGSAKVKNVVQELGFLSPDATWDFSLDEIAFYKGTPPAAPIMAPAAP